MALVVSIQITAIRMDGTIQLQDIETLEIVRQEALKHASNPSDELHNYTVKTHIEKGPLVHFTHRYGDGAAICVQKALQALNDPKESTLV